MSASLKLSNTRSASLRISALIRRVVVFKFPFFNDTIVTETFRARNQVNRGEVIVSQRRGAGSITTPIIKYQIVDASTGRPITNSVTVTGIRTVAFSFRLPAGTYKLQMANVGSTNVGSGGASVQGALLVFSR